MVSSLCYRPFFKGIIFIVCSGHQALLLTGRVQALVFALSWRIAKLSLQLSKNDACTLLQAGVLSFGADSFTLLILKLLLMF
jgi:hypothetical protein